MLTYRHRFYYLIKPFVPWRVRITLRRILARRKRVQCQHSWPINAAVGQTPKGWTGWPEGKKFAFVLTHDVESLEGLAKCRELADLELNLGYRSSFNFIPEGAYRVSPELRTWLAEHGFEVGVHDLQHDGRLFGSAEDFKHKALRINHYLSTWNAVGFRSGFMLRNLDWLHKLNIRYDSSTFDTDPFEFQPRGVDTIFPFWIPSTPAIDADRRTSPPSADAGQEAARAGYFELPYTLPQDSTLFIILREPSPEIWLRKLDWIASRGGMALVNVHPDYMNFSANPNTQKEYDASLYAELLRYATDKYAGQFWNPRPQDLAAWLHTTDLGSPPATPDSNIKSVPTAGLYGKRAAVLLYSNFPSDPRPRRAAVAMVEAGMEVDLFCLSESEEDARQETVDGVRVHRLPMQHSRGSKWAYFWQYGRFFLSSFWFLNWRNPRRKFDLVHVHNMPDFLVFATLIQKIFGAKIILDLHDPMPELMMTIFGADKKSLGVSFLKRVEKWSTGFASAVITVNEACRRIFSNRSCPADKITVIMNSPDEDIFAEQKQEAETRQPGTPFVIMYHGSLVERHGLDLAVTALTKVRQFAPEAELRVYGNRTPYLERVLKSEEAVSLGSALQYYGPLELDKIAQAIRDSDVGVIPNRRSIFTELNTPTRIFEYLSQMRPIIAPRAPGILDYFGPNDLVYFELGDAQDLARQIEFVYREPVAVQAIVRRGHSVYLDRRWSSERKRFLALVSNLLGLNKHPASTALQAKSAPVQGGL